MDATVAAIICRDDARQVWVRAILWHPTKVALRLSITTLIDTGCGGGSYCSEAFINAVRDNCFHGDSIVSQRGKGSLRAANPTDSQIPPMEVIGSVRLPLLFPPDDKVRIITFRVVRKLPYGCIVGASFLRQNASVLSFGNEGGFKPEPASPWVPFVSNGVSPKLTLQK